MLLQGKKIAEQIREKLKQEIVQKAKRPPALAVFLLGHNPASEIYVNNKRRACEEIGIVSVLEKHPETISKEALLRAVHTCNDNPAIDGILVQLPLPSHIPPQEVVDAICPEKDVDGFHPMNQGKLLQGRTDGFIACTPLGVRVLLAAYHIPTEGKHAVILGRSEIVGKPLAALLMQKSFLGNATVTIAHRYTQNLKELAHQADLLIAAMGSPRFVKQDMVKEGAVVVDIGTTPEVAEGQKRRLVGDVAFEEVHERCAAITPVPGGIGPMTIAMLLSNTWKSYCLREKIPYSPPFHV